MLSIKTNTKTPKKNPKWVETIHNCWFYWDYAILCDFNEILNTLGFYSGFKSYRGAKSQNPWIPRINNEKYNKKTYKTVQLRSTFQCTGFYIRTSVKHPHVQHVQCYKRSQCLLVIYDKTKWQSNLIKWLLMIVFQFQQQLVSYNYKKHIQLIFQKSINEWNLARSHSTHTLHTTQTQQFLLASISKMDKIITMISHFLGNLRTKIILEILEPGLFLIWSNVISVAILSNQSQPAFESFSI
jgi:hypothetical protein